MQETFKPHLLLKIGPQERTLLQLLAEKLVLLEYRGRWCSFQYKLADECFTNAPFLFLYIQFDHAFLHYGQFQKGDKVQFYYTGTPLASAVVEEVLDPLLRYWDDAQLPCDILKKKPFLPETINTIFSEWKAALSNHCISLTYELHETNQQLSIKHLKHQTLLLSNAWQICQVFNNTPIYCYYKIAYIPPAYGFIDIFLKEFSMNFILCNEKHFTTGSLRVD